MGFHSGMTQSHLLRVFLCSLLALVVILSSAAQAPDKGKYLFYVGTYTENGSTSKGIYVYRYDGGVEGQQKYNIA